MEPKDYLEFAGPDEIKIKGHRIGLEHVVDLYQDGHTAEQIAEEFPGLPREKIDATISYYLTHKAEVDAYLARLADLEERQIREESLTEPPAVVRRLRALKAQRQHARR
jgi:uncharacterized protein (DUF433 family)